MAAPGYSAIRTIILNETVLHAQVDEGYFSVPKAVEFPTEGGLSAFMNFYPPHNADYALPPGELPPLLIKIHGGPTSQASTGFSLSIQYWTSRGAPLWHLLNLRWLH